MSFYMFLISPTNPFGLDQCVHLRSIISLRKLACILTSLIFPIYNFLKYVMSLGDLNLLFILFFIIFLSIVLNVNTSLHLLLTAEFMWITLYVITLLMGLIFNNVNLLSLTFFLLILSAVEFGLGLVIILIQNIFLRSISLNLNNVNSLKFMSRYKNKLNVNTTKFI